MKKNKYLIINLIIFLIYFCTGLFLSYFEKINLLISLLTVYAGYLLCFILSIIPAVINVIKKKKLYMLNTFIYGIILNLDFIITYVLFFSLRIINFNIYVLDIILFIKLLFILISIPLHELYYERVGFFYINLIKRLIEKIFNVRIIPEEQDKKNINNSLIKESGIHLFISNFILQISRLKKSFNNSIKNVFDSKSNKKRFLYTAIIILSCFIIFTGCLTAFKIYGNKYLCSVKSFTPEGFTEQKMVIKVVFSSEIEFKNPENPGNIMDIKPPISGVYKIEGRTLIFIPDHDLPLSTKYSVSINTSLLRAPNKKSIKGGNFLFNTRLMEVVNSSFYFNVNKKTKRPEELIGEVEFSLPVDLETLNERIEVRFDNKDLNFEKIEPSGISNIIYIRIKGLEQDYDQHNIDIRIKKGVMPVEGALGIEDDYKRTVVLKARERLRVEKCDTFPVIGNTFIAIKFNLPVDESNVKDFISVTPAINYKVSSEYRYIILEANFEPNIRYEVKIKKEIKARDGSDMKDDYKKTVTIRDMAPYVKFTSQGKILPMTDNLNLEFVSLNLDEVKLSVEKIYKNNIVGYIQSEYDYGYGDYNRKFLHSKDLKIKEGNINEEVKNLINLKDLFNSKYQGLYNIKLSDPKKYYNYSSITVNITNIGLIVKNNNEDLIVYAVNILDLKPINNVKVSLLSSENQILQEGFTDEGGRVAFKDFNLTIEDLNPYLIFAEKGNDFTFLPLGMNHVDYSTFNISGNRFDKDKIEAYVKTERGVYRPGEDVYISVIIRKSNLDNPESVPLNMRVKDPTGNIVFTQTFKIDTSGVEAVTVPTKYQYKTGGYYVEILQDNNEIIGSTDFKIEDFIPHKIEVKLNILENLKDKIKFKVTSNHLHGAPAKNLKVNCNVVFRSERFFKEKYKDYNFYDYNKKDFYQFRLELGDDILDENGEKYYEVEIPKSLDPPSMLRAIIYAEVFDDTGRPVGDAVDVEKHKFNAYYGVKTEGKKPYIVNKDINVKYVALDIDGNEINAGKVNLKIERQVWYTIFKKFSWTNKYSSEYYNEILVEEEIDLDKNGEWSFKPDKGGQYTVTISKDGGMSTTTSFFVNDRDDKDYRDMSDPYKLIMELDKTDYNIGDTAYLNILSPFEGAAVVSFEREKVYKSIYIDLSKGKAIIPIKITDDFIPNMYVTAVAYRKPSYEHLTLPPISYGAVNIALNKNKIEQKVEINTKDKIRSSDGLKVNVKIPNGAGSKVIIAAVDIGILQITNYKTPDPHDYFYRKRKLSVMTNTTLKDLLPDIAPYKKAFGGGGDMDVDRRHLNPIIAKRIKSMSLFSGVLECDNNGNVSHEFKMDQFNGKVRIMVYSAKDKKFGSTEKDITVSDPIVLVPGIPRIMAPGDMSYVPVKVYNKTGKTGNFSIKADTDGPIKIEGKNQLDVEIENENEKEIIFILRAMNDAGVAHFKLNAEGNNEKTFHETEFAVRPATPLFTSIDQGVIAKNIEKKVIIEKDYIPEGRFKELYISGNKLVRCLGALEYLIRYPYGCTEQTVSSAFPLIYLKELAKNASIFSKNPYLIDKYVDIAIKTLEKRMLSDGNFAFWDGGTYGYDWTSDYASHFLIEAKKSGYPVSDEVYDKIIKRLGIAEKVNKGRLDRRDDNIDYYYSKTPYRLFLRSVIGKPDYDNLRYYYDLLKDKKENEKLSERDRCLLSAAYALVGDKEKAGDFLPDAFVIKTLYRKSTDTFDSYVRNTALYLYALSMINPLDRRIEYLENELFKNITKKGHFGNTQDTAWALMALSMSREAKNENINAEIYVNGSLWKKITKETQIKTDELNDKEYIIKNIGEKPCYFILTTFGYPLMPDPNEEYSGLVVQKEFLDANGNVIDIKSVKQGDQVVVSLIVENKTKEPVENLILLDLLPAGFEIENTRIASRGDFSRIPQNYINIDYEDIRDDRIIISVRKMTDRLRFSYVVRGVSPGKYIIPQFQAEAMYDPEIFGRTRGGEELIVKKSE